MNLLKWYRDQQLKRCERQQKQVESYLGFEQAQNFALFFEYGEMDERAIKNLAEQLREQGKNVNILTYFPLKKSDMKPDFDVPYFAKNQINWIGKPRSEGYRDFMAKSYDVFINFTETSQTAFRFVNTCIQARLQIGFQVDEKNGADLTLDVSPHQDFERTTDEIFKYLKFINTHAEI